MSRLSSRDRNPPPIFHAAVSGQPLVSGVVRRSHERGRFFGERIRFSGERSRFFGSAERRAEIVSGETQWIFLMS